MRKLNCPLCQREVFAAADTDMFGHPEEVLLYHTPTGPAPTHINSVHCLGSSLTPEFAQWVAEDMAAGRHLMPHP